MKPLIKYTLYSFLFVAIIILIVIGIGFYYWVDNCGLLGCGSHDEVTRILSPSGKIEAILVENNYGATTDFTYDVYVVNKGNSFKNASSVAFLAGAARNKSASGANLEWKSSSILLVKYLNADDVILRMNGTKIENETINIKLVEGVYDPSAPSGGMLFNKENAN